MDLTEILKGHEGEAFYCALTGGDATLLNVYESAIEFRRGELGPPITLASNGGFVISGECQVFPTEDQRDWVRWDKENNHKRIPKTWDEYLTCYEEDDDEPTLWFGADIVRDNVGDACIALFKIYQLIEVGYGGNVSEISYHTAGITPELNIEIAEEFDEDFRLFKPFIFKNSQLAKEFLSYPENIQLLKDFYMI